jgi:hypothetical protein
MSETEHVSYDQAVAMLPEGDNQHTFLNPQGMLLGADTSRAHILQLLKEADEIYLSGPYMTAMLHGLCVLDEKGEPTFIETRQEEEKER